MPASRAMVDPDKLKAILKSSKTATPARVPTMHRICNFVMKSPNISQENKAAKAGKVKNRTIAVDKGMLRMAVINKKKVMQPVTLRSTISFGLFVLNSAPFHPKKITSKAKLPPHRINAISQTRKAGPINLINPSRTAKIRAAASIKRGPAIDLVLLFDVETAWGIFRVVNIRVNRKRSLSVVHRPLSVDENAIVVCRFTTQQRTTDYKPRTL